MGKKTYQLMREKSPKAAQNEMQMITISKLLIKASYPDHDSASRQWQVSQSQTPLPAMYRHYGSLGDCAMQRWQSVTIVSVLPFHCPWLCPGEVTYVTIASTVAQEEPSIIQVALQKYEMKIKAIYLVNIFVKTGK